MGPLATCRLSRDEWWSVRWLALLVCLVVSNINGTVGQKEEGDACVTVSGHRGTCQEFYACPTLTPSPSLRDTCGFQSTATIVCCAHAFDDSEPTASRPQYQKQQSSQYHQQPSQYHQQQPSQYHQQPSQYHQQQPSQYYQQQPSQYYQQQPSQYHQQQPSQYHQQQPSQYHQQPSQYHQQQPSQYHQQQSSQYHQQQSSQYHQQQPSQYKKQQPSQYKKQQPSQYQKQQPSQYKKQQPSQYHQQQPLQYQKQQSSPDQNYMEQQQQQQQQQQQHQHQQQPLHQGGSISKAKCAAYSRPVRPIVTALHLLPGDDDTVQLQVEKCEFNRLTLIVGGDNVTLGEFPHMAALGYQAAGSETISWACGGSLISETFVLTAAHCTYLRGSKLVVVRLGELNLKSDRDGASPVDYPVGEVILHPDYSSRAHYNDIALLRLSRQVEFNDNIRPACLYTQSNFKVGKAVATGWGIVDSMDEDISDVLLKVTIDIVSNPECNRLNSELAASSTKLKDGIVPSMMCAGEAKGGKDTCQGDSGGPLQISDEKNRCIHYVIGITSFGQSCAQENSAGVYTRVSAYVPWIESKVWPAG